MAIITICGIEWRLPGSKGWINEFRGMHAVSSLQNAWHSKPPQSRHSSNGFPICYSHANI